MNRKKRLTLYLVLTLLLMALLVGYRIYLFVREADYQALNAENMDRIEAKLRGRSEYRFAVVGNIRNSMRIFEKRITPLIEDNNADFMISVGNAVFDGAESKYRLLYRGLRKLDIPYVLSAGHNELEDFGTGKFYRHFGPYFFSFHHENTYFIFLDSTGKTSWKWQMRWLRNELTAASQFKYRFVFLNHSLVALPDFNPKETHYVLDANLSMELRQLFSYYHVTTVFSAGYPTFHERVEQGVRYIISGGGGGLHFDRQEPYQIINVDVGPDQTTIKNVEATERLGTLREKLETLKLYLHSLFYMSLFNALLVLSIISLIALKLYSLILHQERLYRDFSVDETSFSHMPLRVAMFTNNYLPFIGGVPLSIDRLYRGLLQAGNKVKIFAPFYPAPWSMSEDANITRCSTLFNLRLAGFPVTNLFSPKIKTEFTDFECDLVHVHHPFWLGKKGMRLAKKRKLPLVFTYHTRLERYTHYLPFRGTVLKNLAAHLLIKRFANHCDAIITPTPSTEEYLRNLGVSALIETIPTGIDMEIYNRWTPQQIQALRNQYTTTDEILLISVSRMAKEKNLDFLIDGLEKVKKLIPVPFKCLLVGEGPERKRLEEKVSMLGLDQQIIFTGNMQPQDVALCYLAADLFIFASTSETQGMVLIEAMAAGCPVVAVRASGVHDVVRNDYNGLMVAESTESWSKAVATLVLDSKKLSQLSENSMVFASDYAEEKIAEQVIKLYRRVIVLGKAETF
ncbi:glycosyltransferase [Desulfogranum japonicum]|uniref:glycosyltransferase n=1 Tax=Desulfogranum japonicum TaxID=231447 RepID=UPI000403F1DD|nr:glycosyltransferase [Desulfogranum japonicum]